MSQLERPGILSSAPGLHELWDGWVWSHSRACGIRDAVAKPEACWIGGRQACAMSPRGVRPSRAAAYSRPMSPSHTATAFGIPMPRPRNEVRWFSASMQIPTGFAQPRPEHARWEERCVRSYAKPRSKRVEPGWYSAPKRFLRKNQDAEYGRSIGVVRDRTTRGYRQRSFESGSTAQK